MKKVWLKVGIGLVVASGAYLGVSYIIKKIQEKRALNALNSNEENKTPRNTTVKKGDDKLPLKKGSYGERVKVLQEALLKKYNYNLGTTGANKDGVDGDFGSLTDAAVRKLQARQDYATNYGLLANAGTPFKFGEVDSVTYVLITGKSA